MGLLSLIFSDFNLEILFHPAPTWLILVKLGIKDLPMHKLFRIYSRFRIEKPSWVQLLVWLLGIFSKLPLSLRKWPSGVIVIGKVIVEIMGGVRGHFCNRGRLDGIVLEKFIRALWSGHRLRFGCTWHVLNNNFIILAKSITYIFY